MARTSRSFDSISTRCCSNRQDSIEKAFCIQDAAMFQREPLDDVFHLAREQQVHESSNRCDSISSTIQEIIRPVNLSNRTSRMNPQSSIHLHLFNTLTKFHLSPSAVQEEREILTRSAGSSPPAEACKRIAV